MVVRNLKGSISLEKQPYIRLNFSSDHSGRKLGVAEIVSIIKDQITAQGDLKGCRLPPVRVLSHQLGISKNTVQTAYEELKAQGLVESRNRAGLFVAGNIEPVSIKPIIDVPQPELKQYSVARYDIPTSKDKVHLSSVFIDPRILPKEKLTACFRSVLKNPGIPEFHHPQGLPALREKIAERLRNRGMDVNSDHIIMTNGSQQALDLVTRALKTKVVATENPAYYLGKYLFEMHGMKTIGLTIDPFKGVDEDQWQKTLQKERPGLVYITTNFQNPNGFSYTSHEISKIVHWSREFGFGILEDDWGSDMLSFSEFKPGLRSIGGKNVLYMNSFTKKLLPSLRIGYLVANEDSIDTLLLAKKVSTSAIPAIGEYALFEFLDRGYFDTHLKNIQEELDIRYENCLSLLRELMPKEIKWTTPGGGPILWIELPERIDLGILEAILNEKNYQIQKSTPAFFGKPHLHGFKLGYAFLTPQEMAESLEHLSKEIKRLLNA